jgi:hypothetical protein
LGLEKVINPIISTEAASGHNLFRKQSDGNLEKWESDWGSVVRRKEESFVSVVNNSVRWN